MTSALDTYSLKARITPSALLLAPIVLTGGALWPAEQRFGQLVPALLAFALLLLVAQLVRDAGKRKEVRLTQLWGGLPTVIGLRHIGPTGPRDVSALHARLARASLSPLPSLNDERQDPYKADAAYSEAIVSLRERTRDTSRFPTVAAANATYGFRRNMLGVRPVGLPLNAIAVAVNLGALFNDGGFFSQASGPLLGLSVIVSLGLLAMWSVVISPEWVRVAADDYAAQLFNAATNVDGAKP